MLPASLRAYLIVTVGLLGWATLPHDQFALAGEFAQVAQEAMQQPEIPTLPEVIVEGSVANEGPLTNPDPFASNQPPISTPTIVGRGQNLLGIAQSASQGVVGPENIEFRPFLRPAEVLETIPGMIVTQHSGSGKANQYFLRGVNLDHGTDFSAFVDDVPINLPTHGHGQGYLDLNFLIPELIQSIEFKKGPYFAEVGDFSTVGTANINLYNSLPNGFARLEGGQYNRWRAVGVINSQVGRGTLFGAFETIYYDGPWVLPEALRKFNGFLKYTLGDELQGITFSALAYNAEWNSTDQIPLRAARSGQISRLGNIDPTDGGRTTRVGLNAQYWRENSRGSLTKANVYSTYYRLNLFSNFTYFLDDPVNGDQFEQFDRRVTLGARISHAWDSYFANWLRNEAGFWVRNDRIPAVGLNHTLRRSELSPVRDDDVNETCIAGYFKNNFQVADRVRIFTGLRGDLFNFQVSDRYVDANSGRKTATILSPKAGLSLGPWQDTELYGNWGLAFHSNDARGVTTTIDPTTGDPVDPATPLVRTGGQEVGLRTTLIPNLTTTVALWQLSFDSELLFVGDAGTNEPSRPSRRNGVEWTNFYQVNDWLLIDADFAFTHAGFIDESPDGQRIPGALNNVVTLGATIVNECGWFTTIRLRHFGPRPLIEDNSVRSNSTSVVNWRVGYNYRRLQVGMDILNLFNTHDHDIDYYYVSRLPGEPADGVADIHFHPVEPFNTRLYATLVY